PDLFEYFSMLTGGFPEPFTFGQRLKAYFLEHGNPYDVVHDNQTLAPGVLALQRWGVPLVTTIHHPIQRDLALALDQQRDWKGRLLVRRWHHFLRMQERVVPQLKHLVTVSAASRDAIAEAFRIPAGRIKVVHNGVDSTRWAPLPEVPRAPATLLTVASADQPLKGLTVLLEALATLRKSHPTVTLRVIGKLNPDGPTGARLQALGLGEAVTFEAGLSEAALRQRYAEATLAVVPSLYEGFGFPAAEAMACGTPLVSSTGGALGEVVGDAGLTVPPGDSAALAHAIDQLLQAPELRLGLGARGRSRALEQFSWARAGAAMVQCYQEARSP
ncbi:MAG: glycosyltransferase family 4 protein, partial [Pseudomonadales bacterium]